MWNVIEPVLEFLDLVAHWRFYGCFLGGLGLAFLMRRVVPDPSIASPVALALVVGGFMAGLIWEWRR